MEKGQRESSPVAHSRIGDHHWDRSKAGPPCQPLTGIQLAVFWIDELVEEGIGKAIPGSQEYTAAQDTTERKSCIRVHYGPTLDTLFIRILTGVIGTCSSCCLTAAGHSG